MLSRHGARGLASLGDGTRRKSWEPPTAPEPAHLALLLGWRPEDALALAALRA